MHVDNIMVNPNIHNNKVKDLYVLNILNYIALPVNTIQRLNDSKIFY